MRRFELTVETRGSLLIGGGQVPNGLHGSHIEDEHGKPIVPASAIRGALRETLEALLRGVGRPACAAGFSSATALESDEHDCDLDGGKPCPVCRLFGGGRSRVPAGARDFSSLIVGDGHLRSDGGDQWMLRPGVAVSRASRSAAEDRLFLRRTTATKSVFVAEGWLREAELVAELEAAVQATMHLGSGRSRGTARVDLRLEWKDHEDSEHGELPEGNLRVRMKLLSPAILGVPLAQTNLRETRKEVPGTAFRGAVGFALANALDDPDNDVAFQALVDETSGARFGFLHPVDRDSSNGVEPPGRLPSTALACKGHGIEHGLYDDLLDRIATALVESADQVDTVHGARRAATCTACGKPLRGISGFRRHTKDVPVRVVTRASIDRPSSTVRDGALFTEVYCASGVTFEGQLRGIPDDSRQHLKRLLGLPVSVGRARGAGRGRVQLELDRLPSRPALTQRGEAFNLVLKKHLERCRLPRDEVADLVPLTFLSPLILQSSPEDEWTSLREYLPLALQEATPLVRVRRFVRDGSWDQRRGQMLAWQAIDAGAVYVLKLPAGTLWRDVASEIEQLERDAVGNRRHQGYGEVYAFDPIHCKQEQG